MAVLNKHHLKGIDGAAINIMRPSRWGNPFVIGKDGSRDEVVEKYRQWLWRKLKADQAFADQVRLLHGRDLVCCCAPLPCHGHVLERAAAWLARSGEVSFLGEKR